jgi:hypothetical protein
MYLKDPKLPQKNSLEHSLPNIHLQDKGNSVILFWKEEEVSEVQST